MPLERLLVIPKGKRKAQQNKPLVTKRKSKKCISSMRMIVSAGMKRNRLMKICWMKLKISYNYGIQTFNKERIARRCRWYD